MHGLQNLLLMLKWRSLQDYLWTTSTNTRMVKALLRWSVLVRSFEPHRRDLQLHIWCLLVSPSSYQALTLQKNIICWYTFASPSRLWLGSALQCISCCLSGPTWQYFESTVDHAEFAIDHALYGMLLYMMDSWFSYVDAFNADDDLSLRRRWILYAEDAW